MPNYERYSEWKGWSPDKFLVCTPHERQYFSGELRGLKLKGARVLEIGFGNGNFLRYVMDEGAIVAGTELLDNAATCAVERGICVYSLDLSDALERSPGQFDLVAAFDVLEHMTFRQIVELFEKLAVLLPPGGHVIARFPNGQSPLGRVPQYGDRTHQSVLSPTLLMQLLSAKPWKLVRAGNPFMVIQGHGFLKRAGLHVRHASKAFVEFAVNRMYGLNITLDPNVTIVLRRTEE